MRWSGNATGNRPRQHYAASDDWAGVEYGE